MNAQAQQVAGQPFQQYSTNPNAFVAPLTPTQTAGMTNINNAQGMAQPYYNAATGFALAGSQPITAQPLDVGQYMNPYLNTVLGSTAALINQNNQQAMAGQTGNAINQGYFGGDRSGIASAVLQGQQNLAAGQVYSGIASDAYNQAMAAAQQQQGVNLGAAQANRAALQATGQDLAGLGTTAQGTALAGAQAQLGAGQVEQQTQQAGLSALYNQFLQQQSYPFQVAQFLANIAEGTGALSGSTTTQTTPGGLFSDARLKTDIHKIGKGFDGADIYRFRYKGDPSNVTRIGFMAQEVEQRHPEAVHTDPASGFKMVDYDLATRESAGFARAANDDFSDAPEPRRARAFGGGFRLARQVGGMSQMPMYPAGANPFSISELLQAQAQMYGPFTSAGLYGNAPTGAPHGGAQGYVPNASLPVPQLMQAHPISAPQGGGLEDALHSAASMAGDVKGLQEGAHDIHSGYDWLRGKLGGSGGGSSVSVQDYVNSGGWADGGFVRAARAEGGGDLAGLSGRTPPTGFSPALAALARQGYDDGGSISDTSNDDPYKDKGPGLNIPTQETQHPKLQTAQSISSGGPSGLQQALGMGADIASIASAAPAIGSMAAGAGSAISSLLPFLAFLKDGGRVGYAEGGAPFMEEQLGDLEGKDKDPLMDQLLRGVMAPHPPPEPEPGFGGAAAKAPESPAGGGGGGGGPSAGFAGAGPPGTTAAPAEGGFAGAGGPGMAGILKAEGYGKNPMSSARGPGQFIDSTFIRMFRKTNPERAAGMTDPEIKALRSTPEGDALSASMIPALDRENAAALSAAGYEPNATNRHLAWVLGAGGAKKLLGADPSTPMESLFSPGVISANRRIMAGKTAGEFRAWAAKGMNKGGRVGFQGGGFADDFQVNDTDDVLKGFAKAAAKDPAILAAAQANREAASAGQASTPAAADAVAAVPASAPPPPPPVDSAGPRVSQGLAQATDFSGAAQPQRAVAPAGAAAPQPSPGIDPNYWDARMQQANAQYEQTVQQQRGPQGGGIMGMLQRNWIPILEGVGAWAGAPTQHPLVALAMGASRFAQGEQAQREYQLGQARTGAELEQTGANTAGGLYGQGTARANVMLNALGTAMPAFDSQFFDTGRTQRRTPNGPPEKVFADMRPGQPPGATILEGDLTRLRNQQRLGLLTSVFGSGDPSRTIPQFYGSLTGPAGGVSAPTGPTSNVSNVPPNAVTPPPGPPGPSGAAVPPAGVSETGAGRAPAGPAAPASGAQPAVAQPFQAEPERPPAANLKAGLERGDYLEPTPTRKPTSDGLDPEWDPLKLPDMISDEQTRGSPLADVHSDRLKKILDGTLPAKTLPDAQGVQHDDNRWQTYANSVASQKALSDKGTATIADLNARQGTFAQDYQTESQVLNSMIDVLKTNDPEGMTGEITEMVSKLRSTPLGKYLPPDLVKFQDAAGILTKEGARLALNGISQAFLDGAPASGLAQSNLTVPDYHRGARAKYELISELGGLLGQQRAFNADWSTYKDKVGPARAGDYVQHWYGENPISRFQRGATEKIPYFAGMSDDDKAMYARHPKNRDAAQALPPHTPYYPPGVPETRANLRWTPRAPAPAS